MLDEVKAAILAHTSIDPQFISADINKRFGRFVPPTVITKIRGGNQRVENVSRARTAVSDTLDDKVQVMEQVSGDLLDVFNNQSLPMKERIEAAKELRQWVGMVVKMAGIADEESNTLFVVDGAWDHSPKEKN